MSAPTAAAVAGPQAADAYRLIRRAIVEGAYAPGQRLVEQRLAEEHGLSRTPVREALRRLQAEGLVDVERHRGAAVRRLSADDISDIYELRSVGLSDLDVLDLNNMVSYYNYINRVVMGLGLRSTMSTTHEATKAQPDGEHPDD